MLFLEGRTRCTAGKVVGKRTGTRIEKIEGPHNSLYIVTIKGVFNHIYNT